MANDWKNAISSASSRLDVCKEFTVWLFASKYTDVNFEKSWLSSHSPWHREKPGTLVLPCVLNVVGKISNQTPAG